MVQISWRTGVNMREFAFYGTAAVQHTDIGLQRRQLDQLQPLQTKLVRFYGSFVQLSTAESVNRVRAALDLLNQYGMQGIVCMMDSLSSPFTIAGDDPYHTGPWGHLNKQYWHEKAFRRHYIPHVTSLAGAVGDHPALFMFELGNEIAIHPQPASPNDGQAFYEFAQEASEAIKTAAPRSLLSTGLVNTNHVAPAGQHVAYCRKFYALDTLDAISIHYYADDGEENYAHVEVSAAEALGKPYYIGEFGAPEHWHDRAGYYRDQMNKWMNRGAFTAMPWAFDSSPSDVGVSDDKALSPIRPAYHEIRNIVQSFSRPAQPVAVTAWSKGGVPKMSMLTFQPEPSAPGPSIMETIPGTDPTWPPAQIKTFVVVDGPLKVRTAPRLGRDTVVQGVLLNNSENIDVDADSRTEADGNVWWRHQRGWSAERSTINPLEVTMSEVTPVMTIPAPPAVVAPPPEPVAPPPVVVVVTPPVAPPPPPPVIPPIVVMPVMPPKLNAVPIVIKKDFRVIDGPLSVRDSPTLEPRAVIKGLSFRTGQRVEVDATSRTEADNYVWWRHDAGWSAERSIIDPTLVFMVEERESKADEVLFEKLPLDLSLIRWFYYYGNTRYAFVHGASKGYDAYSQGLHGGLDFGHPGGAPIVTGLRADLGGRCTYVGDKRKFGPNRVDVQVGPYLLIYGHVASPNFGLQGQTVGPDTHIGVIDGGQRHLHLELRMGGKILNPLDFFPQALTDALIARFPARDEFGFQPFGGKWEGPDDQPTIDIGGPVRGPRGS
jgi:hypothetical protein